MRLSVQVLPSASSSTTPQNDIKSPAPPPSSDATSPPPSRKQSETRRFLQICDDKITLLALSDLIRTQFNNLYVGSSGAPNEQPLEIKKLQNSAGDDLSLSYTVQDVFNCTTGNDVILVHRLDRSRACSIPPESLLRPAAPEERGPGTSLPTSASAEITSTPPIPKKRGRPPGSKSKPKPKPGVAGEVIPETDEEAGGAEPAKKRVKRSPSKELGKTQQDGGDGDGQSAKLLQSIEVPPPPPGQSQCSVNQTDSQRGQQTVTSSSQPSEPPRQKRKYVRKQPLASAKNKSPEDASKAQPGLKPPAISSAKPSPQPSARSAKSPSAQIPRSTPSLSTAPGNSKEDDDMQKTIDLPDAPAQAPVEKPVRKENGKGEKIGAQLDREVSEEDDDDQHSHTASEVELMRIQLEHDSVIKHLGSLAKGMTVPSTQPPMNGTRTGPIDTSPEESESEEEDPDGYAVDPSAVDIRASPKVPEAKQELPTEKRATSERKDSPAITATAGPKPKGTEKEQQAKGKSPSDVTQHKKEEGAKSSTIELPRQDLKDRKAEVTESESDSGSEEQESESDEEEESESEDATDDKVQKLERKSPLEAPQEPTREKSPSATKATIQPQVNGVKAERAKEVKKSDSEEGDDSSDESEEEEESNESSSEEESESEAESEASEAAKFAAPEKTPVPKATKSPPSAPITAAPQKPKGPTPFKAPELPTGKKKVSGVSGKDSDSSSSDSSSADSESESDSSSSGNEVGKGKNGGFSRGLYKAMSMFGSTPKKTGGGGGGQWGR